MEPIAFSMVGTPIGKGRPRATARGGFARVYTPAPTRLYEGSVAAAARAFMAGRPPLRGG